MSDLSPLKDMKLTSLDCGDTQVSDLSPLKDMKLTNLDCSDTQVSDLSPLKDMKLTTWTASSTQVSDLSPLKDMKLTTLCCDGTQCIRPVAAAGDAAKELHCDFKPERDAEILSVSRCLSHLEGAESKWLSRRGANRSRPCPPRSKWRPSPAN